MIIRSRPSTKQACESIVEAALAQMCGITSSAIPLDQHEKTLGMIMKTLKLSGILTNYEIGTTRETKQSTYEKTEWLIRIKFTDDPSLKTGYIADLIFHYFH